MADVGSRRIARLLNQDAPELKEELATIAEAASDAYKNPYGVMSLKGIEAVSNVRQYYRGLRKSINRIGTDDGAAKTAALQALDALDNALDSYEQSLELGISPPALPKVKSAEKKARNAKKLMDASIAGLSR